MEIIIFAIPLMLLGAMYVDCAIFHYEMPFDKGFIALYVLKSAGCAAAYHFWGNGGLILAGIAVIAIEIRHAMRMKKVNEK